MSVAYCIAPRGAGITEHSIPAAGITLADGTRLLDGDENEFWRTWTLGKVAEVVGRCTPWAVTWCAPVIECPKGKSWGGSCIAGCLTLAVSTESGPSSAVSTAYHECGHAVDGHLLPGALATMEAATSGIVEWPGDYYASPAERHARFFEHTAMALDAGAMLHIVPGSATETAWQMYTGAFSRQRDAAIAAAEAARVAAARPRLFRRMKELAHHG